MAWDAAGRPGTDQPPHRRLPLRRRAPGQRRRPHQGRAGVPHQASGRLPRPDTGGIVHVTPHATFVISSSRA